MDVTDADFLAAVQECAAMGMTCRDIDALRRWPARTTENWINRLKKRFQRSGRQFPDLGFVKGHAFSEEEVVSIRERSACGTTDVLLAVEYDVNRETIRSIVRGQRYAQFGGPIRQARSEEAVKASREYMCGHADNSQAGGFQASNAVLAPKDRDVIRDRSLNGEDVKELAQEYQVSATTIRKNAA